MQPLTGVVKNLIIINVIVFIGSQIFPHYGDMLALWSPNTGRFMPFQVVTNMFAHADVSHIAFNMLGLYFLGPILERALQEKKFLILYMIAGLGGVALHFLIWYLPVFGGADINTLRPFALLGASGAVFGVMAGFAYLYPNAPLRLIFPPVSLPAKYFVMIYIVLGVVLQFSGRGGMVAHMAHLGGALFGVLTMMYWRRKKEI